MTTKLGILTLDPLNRQDYFTKIGMRSKQYGTDLYLFSPLDLVPGTQMVKGFRFDTGKKQWSGCEFQIPACLYDRCFYGEDQASKDARKIVSWLKERKDITFLGYGLPNKGNLYDRLKDDPRISPYLPKTIRATDPERVLSELNRYNSVILKPINGAHGYAIYALEKTGDSILVKTTKSGKLISKTFADLGAFSKWLDIILTKQIFLIQARLDNVNNRHQPFDLRIFLQKDKNGHWREMARGIRTGAANGILTNMSAGASISAYEDWKQQTPYFNHSYLEHEIAALIAELPHVLEETFHPLFELGIDLIIASDQSIWVLDINSKPGRKLISQLYPERLDQMYEAPLAYCKYLEKHERGAGSKNPAASARQ
ncbi:YheC/YheD family protein [Heyndrickxia acidiproducens]|uniref:YheC/YheD family endospore coat-associated protein n=1 Tax=Heyndrickxia acidiproducens TaxID=1121084 RepID=UPI0003701101|nr:YheC/YheD family protein [Heyndrickxia acidiproducens]